MKTLEEVFKEAGVKFPFCAVFKNSDYAVTIVARSPNGDWLGWNANQCGNSWGSDISNQKTWTLYTPPKPTVKMYQALVESQFKHKKKWITTELFKDEHEASDYLQHGHFIRLLTEYPIEVPCE